MVSLYSARDVDIGAFILRMFICSTLLNIHSVKSFFSLRVVRHAEVLSGSYLVNFYLNANFWFLIVYCGSKAPRIVAVCNSVCFELAILTFLFLVGHAPPLFSAYPIVDVGRTLSVQFMCFTYWHNVLYNWILYRFSYILYLFIIYIRWLYVSKRHEST